MTRTYQDIVAEIKEINTAKEMDIIECELKKYNIIEKYDKKLKKLLNEAESIENEMLANLVPCRLCGSQKIGVSVTDRFVAGYFCVCENNHSTSRTACFESKIEAVEDWNRVMGSGKNWEDNNE